MKEKRFHSVRLEGEKCRGCTNCLKRCPTEAIRVRGGRAHIIDERCIDCGECIRVCSYHAKVAVTDPLSSISQFKFKIALPAPSLYGQFSNLKSISQVLGGLKRMGFDEVYEVARGADVVSKAIQERLKDPKLPRPVISSACPAIVRLIQVRFPDLIDHIVDVRQPMEVAAMIARTEFARKHGVDPSEIGCFFISPCPAKVTAIRNPIGHTKSAVNGAISVLEIYGLLSSQLKNTPVDLTLEEASDLGVGWARSGGESMAVSPDNSMSVCTGGCVGGPLNFENNYVARSEIRKLTTRDAEPNLNVDAGMMTKYDLYMSGRILPNSAMKLDDDLMEAMRKMEKIEKLYNELPGFDCGSCGSPTCRTFAEDVVQGVATKMDCIHMMKDQLRVMAQQMVDLAKTTRE